MKGDRPRERQISTDLISEALAGLSTSPRRLPTKLLYDEAGLKLFEAMKSGPCYYISRVETALLETIAGEVRELAGEGRVLVEYGASSTEKVIPLLKALKPRMYVPIDQSPQALSQLARELAHCCTVHTIDGDIFGRITLPSVVSGLPTVGLFAGTTIANVEPETATKFLRRARDTLGPGAKLIIGVDLPKDEKTLLAAYDDPEGLAAAFGLNALARLNREGGADFNPTGFRYRATWDQDRQRIDMQLISLRRQSVRLEGAGLEFAEGEAIHLASSYKYAPDEFQNLARSAGWEARRVWMDRDRLFSIHLLAIPHPA